ncbi:hypothetical protein LCGC14_1217470, partial [marine sediment metagenome]
WDSHDKTKKENQVGEFKKAYDNALNIPEKINFYLLIGPKNEWEDYFLKDNSLDKYLDNFIYFF